MARAAWAVVAVAAVPVGRQEGRRVAVSTAGRVETGHLAPGTDAVAGLAAAVAVVLAGGPAGWALAAVAAVVVLA